MPQNGVQQTCCSLIPRRRKLRTGGAMKPAPMVMLVIGQWTTPRCDSFRRCISPSVMWHECAKMHVER